MDNFLYYLQHVLENKPVFPILFALFLMWYILKKKKDQYHSHWNTLIDGFSYSSQEFYERLEGELQNHDVEDITISETTLREGGIGTSNRIYLKVSWKNLNYYVCAAPFGDGFFISWWLLNNASIGSIIVSKMPFIGAWLYRKLYPLTFYKIDTATMFMTYAHQSVLKVIGEITASSGIRPLSELAEKPILLDVFKR